MSHSWWPPALLPRPVGGPFGWAARLMLAGVAVLPALSLVLPSGYSWGSLLMCLAGLLAWRQWRSVWREPAFVAWWAAVLAMGLIWSLDAVLADPFRANTLDRPLKFALALLALPALCLSPERWLVGLRWGIWLGALGAAATAAWQIHGTGMLRAWGHTNAIHFGNLALLLGFWSWIWARNEHGWPHWLGLVAALAGGYASIASESRGGWWTVPLLLALVVVLGKRPEGAATVGRLRALRYRMAVGALAAALLLGWQWDLLRQRADLAWQEVRLHWTTGDSASSVGQRLAHWEFAWQLGAEKPLSGWGEQGYHAEKDRRVALGQAPAVLQAFGHAHNEWLDMWVKRGLPGVVVLALFFGVPLALYARALRGDLSGWAGQAAGAAPVPVGARQAAALCGLVTVAGYVGFGMTQVMFAHNSGTMMFLFMNLVWLGLCVPIRAVSR